jgi:uncharacterized protein (DUF58 family)
LRIDIRVEMPERVVAGKPFETEISLHNRSGRAARALVVRHSWPTSRTLIAAHAIFVDRIDAHQSVTTTTTRTPAARGVLGASEVRIEATAPFGFFSRTIVDIVERELLVLPVLAAIDAIPAGVGGNGPTVRASGADAGAVREWRPGDPVRSVQWRSTAKTGRLTVVERDHTSVGSLVVLIAGRNGEHVLEQAIARVATAGSAALRRGTTVFVARADGMCVRARTQASLLELLARADVREPLDDAALRAVLRAAGDGGSLLVAVGQSVLVSWVPTVRRVAAMAGISVVDVADRVAGVSAGVAPARAGA